MSDKAARIVYTKTDEAPLLATHSFLPILQAFARPYGVNLETSDISLAARILAKFPDFLKADQQVKDDLIEMGELAKDPTANIIKLPNISASVPQLKGAISELQTKGFAIPDYPENPTNEKDKEIRQRYDKIKGSAVNPVIREGNSDRRAPKAVKNYAKQNPHSMGKWDPNSPTHVATMKAGDFRSTEKSVTLKNAVKAKIEHIDSSGKVTVLKDQFSLLAEEIIDASLMSKKKLIAFFEEQISDARVKNLLFSLHMKATMMKVSDPIIFGYAVEVYFKEVLAKFGEVLKKAGVNVRNGFGDLLAKIQNLPEKNAINAEIERAIQNGPAIAMVNSEKGISNLHVPSDVIIDASVPAMIRTSGKMYNAKGELADTAVVIPDSSYALIYQAVMDDCRKNGAYDPTVMGTVSNVGLMAQQAEEYGSHDKTFEIASDGVVRVVTDSGETLLEHPVEQGDIWRMCQVKDAPVRDWVKLTVGRARAANIPAVFWLDADRPHDGELIKKINTYLKDHDTKGLDIRILSMTEATKFSVDRIRKGQDTISVTGNVMRDYLTDLFPILEVGTSAKMLSIVPLMNGGGLFETGAGGSAPKHVEQFLEEGHLRWDSLGEFLATAVSFEFFAEQNNNAQARILAETLDQATEIYLQNDRSPQRDVGEPDNRHSHFYIAMYWAKCLSNQVKDGAIAKKFMEIYRLFAQNEAVIVGELNKAQGANVDLGGYYKPDTEKTFAAMRPSATFNKILEKAAV